MPIRNSIRVYRLQHLRNDVVDPIIRARSGRIIKSLGDGLLVEFASVAEAVQAAMEMNPISMAKVPMLVPACMAAATVTAPIRPE
jgi:class 3 adenylate cyclase